jgi:hypothetical protein
VLCSALVLLSTSTTALLALLLVLTGGLALAALRRAGAVRLVTVSALLMACILIGAVLTIAPEAPLEVLGKDPTLTGRTDIWTSLLRAVDERPLQGYGYAAFWADKLGPAWFVRRDIGWVATTAHNGWLDLLLQLGWTGVALFGAHLALSAFAAGLRLFSGPEGLWVLLSTGLLLLSSLSESTFLLQNNLNTVLYFATTAKLLERRRRRSAGVEPLIVRQAHTPAGPLRAGMLRTSLRPALRNEPGRPDGLVRSVALFSSSGSDRLDARRRTRLSLSVRPQRSRWRIMSDPGLSEFQQRLTGMTVADIRERLAANRISGAEKIAARRNPSASAGGERGRR